MKEMRNIADRGGKHHDPMHGPPGTRVYGLEGVGTTVGAEQEMPEARTPEDFSRAGATPVCAAFQPPQIRFVPIVTSGVAPALEKKKKKIGEQSEHTVKTKHSEIRKRNHTVLIDSSKS